MVVIEAVNSVVNVQVMGVREIGMMLDCEQKATWTPAHALLRSAYRYPMPGRCRDGLMMMV